jgi:parvulin-like peptidyl-prolyl isomerase
MGIACASITFPPQYPGGTLKLKIQVLTLGLLSSVAVAAQTATPAATPSTNPTTQGTPANSAATAGQASTAAAAVNVSPDAPVITINGVCEVTPNATTKPAQAGAGCKTQITRAEFEKVVKAVAPTAPATARRQIASTYVQILSAANEGAKLGVEKDPEFAEQLTLTKLQLLGQAAARKISAQAQDVTDAEVKTYYDQNPSAFEEVTLTRIFVPRGANEGTQGTAAVDSKTIADNARQQLAAGTDPEKIQKAVFEQLKTTTEPPSTKFGAKRRGALPPAHEQKVFALKPGEVSDPIPDSIGYVIYRVDGKQQLPFDQVKEEAKRRITQQRIQEAQQKFVAGSKAEYNDSYFGPETASQPPSLAPGASPAARRGPPPAGRPSAAAAGAAQTTPSQPAKPK